MPARRTNLPPQAGATRANSASLSDPIGADEVGVPIVFASKTRRIATKTNNRPLTSVRSYENGETTLDFTQG